jgi:hypothetical protein
MRNYARLKQLGHMHMDVVLIDVFIVFFSEHYGGVCFHLFVIFISFREIQKLDGSKSEKWKHLSMSFSASHFLGNLTFGSSEI